MRGIEKLSKFNDAGLSPCTNTVFTVTPFLSILSFYNQCSHDCIYTFSQNFMKNYPKITKIAPSKSASHLKFICKTRQFTVRSLTVSLFLINELIAQI